MEGNKEGLPVSSYSWHRFLSLFPTPFSLSSCSSCFRSLKILRRGVRHRVERNPLKLDWTVSPVTSLSPLSLSHTLYFYYFFSFSLPFFQFHASLLLSLSFSFLRDFSPDVRLPSFFPAKIVGKEWNGCNFTRHRFCRLFSRNNKRKGFLIIFRQTNLAIYARRESSNEIFTRLIFEIFEDITMKRRMIDKLSRD